jgi:hypothetical protein
MAGTLENTCAPSQRPAARSADPIAASDSAPEMSSVSTSNPSDRLIADGSMPGAAR